MTQFAQTPQQRWRNNGGLHRKINLSGYTSPQQRRFLRSELEEQTIKTAMSRQDSQNYDEAENSSESWPRIILIRYRNIRTSQKFYASHRSRPIQTQTKHPWKLPNPHANNRKIQPIRKLLTKKKFSTWIMNKPIALTYQAQAGHIQSTSILALARNLWTTHSE